MSLVCRCQCRLINLSFGQQIVLSCYAYHVLSVRYMIGDFCAVLSVLKDRAMTRLFENRFGRFACVIYFGCP